MNQASGAFGLSTLVLFATVHAAAAELMQLVVNGQSRTYLLEQPAVPGPRPTIIMLHGAGAGAQRELQLSGLARLAPREGFVAVVPEGRGGRWNFFPPGQENAQDVQLFQQFGGVPDDVAFIRTLVTDLVRRGISDPSRIYLAGRSLGGVMALRMACVDGERFAAIGLLISAMADVIGTDCHLSKPLPLLAVNGTADPIIPPAGGRSRRGDDLWPTHRMVSFFRRLNGCADPPEQSVLPVQRPQPIEIERWTKCAGGAVIAYRVVGGGHEVPSVVDSGALLLEFFRDKVRDTSPGKTATVSRNAPMKCTRFETRLFADLCNGCTRPPFDQELVRTADTEWTISYVDGTKTQRTYKYQLISESNSEILLYDSSRNISARLDLIGRKGFARRGQSGGWVPLLDILKADCS
jgi:polyhydroxybutyrate depolymerase